MSIKVYDVHHVSGDIHEVEAEFYERQGEDWVFYVGVDEVFRVPFLDVLSVSKTPTWVREEPATPEVWL